MDQLIDYSDSRNKGFCIHCGSGLRHDASNRDHVPTRGLLNPPYPENLPVVEVCRQCNSEFSSDEEYLIAFLGSVISGSTTPDPAISSTASRILARSPQLAKRIARSRTIQGHLWDDAVLVWKPELSRIERVVVKNARGHILYELGVPVLEKPSRISICPIQEMTASQLEQFESVSLGSGWPEVGSRMMRRLVVFRAEDSEEIYFDGWQEVQDEVYRYAVSQESDGILVRMVLHEYLAATVLWDEDIVV